MNALPNAHDPKWLEWAKRLQSLAQSGLTYSEDDFDIGRFEEIRRIAVAMAAYGSATDIEVVRDLFASETGHATPKVAIQAAVFEDRKLLMVRERSDGCWTLPGGWADLYESPSEAVIREVFEESGYRCEPLKLVAAYDRTHHDHTPAPYHLYKLIFTCRITGGAPATSIETDAVGFFDEHELPELSLARVTMRQIHNLFAHRDDSTRAPDFD